VPGTVLTDLIQRSGDVLYSALKRGVGDASEGLEELQRNVKKLLSREGGGRREWIAFTAPDLDRMVQRAVERVLRALDLPTRGDLEALEQRLDHLSQLLGAPPIPRTPRAPRPPAHDLDEDDEDVDDDASLDRPV
jgi:hypothetical protein